MQLDIVNSENKKVGSFAVNDEVFGGRVKSDLVSSVKPTLVAVGTDEDNTLREKIKQAVGVDLW